jgi:transketolase
VQEEKVRMLKSRANQIRRKAITMIYEAKSGHPGGSLSAADIIAALYFSEMRIDPKNPDWEDRDRFVLSKGHSCPAQYAALAMRGYFQEDILHSLRKEGSILQGHPDMKKCPGIDISTGSLGQGFACAAGMALAGKRDGKDYRVFAILGDGECDEGEIWEAANLCQKYKLDNIIVFVDYNRLQLDGPIEEIMPMDNLDERFAAFGFETYAIDGNNMEEIVQVLDTIRDRKNGKPKMILANTVKGKGVSYMENQCGWHGKAPNEEEYMQAMKELNEEASL